MGMQKYMYVTSYLPNQEIIEIAIRINQKKCEFNCYSYLHIYTHNIRYLLRIYVKNFSTRVIALI